MLDKHKQNYAVVENGKLLMCGRKFILGALTLIIHDDEGMFWGRLYAIDDEFNKSEDIKVLNENDNNVYFSEARKDEVEFMEKMDWMVSNERN